MIDIENIVINTVCEALADAEITADVSSVYKEVPEEFPHIYIRQTESATLRKTQDTSLREHHASIRFRLEYFSNKTSGAREEIKRIAGVCDLAMQDMKFTRVAFDFIPNYDRTIQRAYSDYTAIVQEGVTTGQGTENEKTTFQMYRR